MELDNIATRLNASDEFRVLRKLQPRNIINPPDGTPTRIGIFVDVETTGLNPALDEIIELAMVPFTFSDDGRIFEVREPFQSFRQPTCPISTGTTRLTGITQEMVAGKRLDPQEVATFISDASLIVAHHAEFDRRFLERLIPVFADKPWACSMSQIEWAAEGFEGTKLVYLAMQAGFFYERHRAVMDCMAGIELLAARLPVSGGPAMDQLLENAKLPTVRIWAENSPFELKDDLKRRGYRWSGAPGSRARSWFVDVTASEADSELEYLRSHVYGGDARQLPTKWVTAYERFSERAYTAAYR